MTKKKSATVAKAKPLQQEAKTHYFQLCAYQRVQNGAWKQGIAKVTAFDYSDVAFIINASGNKLKQVWDYRLIAQSFYNHAAGIELMETQA